VQKQSPAFLVSARGQSGGLPDIATLKMSQAIAAITREHALRRSGRMTIFVKCTPIPPSIASHLLWELSIKNKSTPSTACNFNLSSKSAAAEFSVGRAIRASLHSPGTGESGARARLAFRISNEAFVDPLRLPCRKSCRQSGALSTIRIGCGSFCSGSNVGKIRQVH
jgi:hypothetical protein